MALTLVNRTDVTLDAVRRVAWGDESVALAPEALERMRAARATFLKLLDSDPNIVIYGVTSGYGQRAHVRFTPDERRRHAARPPRAAGVSFGDPLPERVVRAIVLARLANFVEGHAAVRPELAQAVAGMLDSGPLPQVPSLGNGGAGEVLPLSHLFAELAERVGPQEKESLALINGSPVSAALVADAALAARARVALAHEVFALSAEAFKAPLEAYAPALDALWGEPSEAESLERLRHLLEGAGGERRSYQAPVSFRIVPRHLGRTIRALRQAETAANVSLASVTDNPVYVPPDPDHKLGQILSNGGYQNAIAYPALDELAASWADLCLLAERQTQKILEGRVSHLPDGLMTRPNDDRYMGALGMALVGWGEQARHAAQRTFLPGPESGGFAQNDVASPTFHAWRKERDAATALEACLSVLAIVASQALYVTERPAPQRLASLLAEIRAVVPPLERVRMLGPDCERLAEAFARRVFAV
ncbi:MAG: histidine ammonia-lyase [Alphaproteobacteria bacterium]|nr:histidine ammonia-lyase [Alphaproteobacteria bacterium]